MNDAENHTLSRAPVPAASTSVPVPFAEKAMASLMQLHGELMEEKERRVELYRRLMEKEQSVAELRMYVHLLEERLGLADPSALPRPRAAPPVQVRRQQADSVGFTTAPPPAHESGRGSGRSSEGVAEVRGASASTSPAASAAARPAAKRGAASGAPDVLLDRSAPSRATERSASDAGWKAW